jgi:glycine/D-amino acid oxidase-like deaminating enzyme
VSGGKKYQTSSITESEDLTAGRSVWMHPGANVPARKVRRSFSADVVIVGAGISGAFMAHALSRQFANIAILDRRAPVNGSTAASTAMLQFEIDVPLTRLHEQIGGARASRAWLRSYRATQELVKLVQSENIDCGLEKRRSLYLAGNQMGSRGLRSESRARDRIGLPGEYFNAEKLRACFGIERTGAILSPNSAVADPRRLAAGLLRKSIERGARVYSPARVEGLWTSSTGVVLSVGKYYVECRHCIFCTGYEILKGIPHEGLKITSSWAIATRTESVYPSWFDDTLVWEASSPYLYLRSTPDARIIVGGEDEDRDDAKYRAKSIAPKSAILARKAERMVPGLRVSPALRWAGAFGESVDGLPTIDAVPNMSNCYIAMGFGGNGTIYSVIASQIIPKLMQGRPARDSDLFRFRTAPNTSRHVYH